MSEITITLAGSEVKAKFSGSNAWLRNDGADTIYAAKISGITAGAAGVTSIPAGQSAPVYGADGTVYLLGTGSVMLIGSDYSTNPFKTSAQGGSGADDAARAAINQHAGNVDIHLTAAEKSHWNGLSNPNLLINPDFKINQRNASGTITTPGYFVDRWQLVSGSVTINSDGTLTLNGTIKQILENGAGTNVSANSSAGTATYDNISKAFLLTAAGEVISWVKLEKGSLATQFVPPDPTTELLKCQRYFHRLGGKNRYFRLYGIAYDSYDIKFSYQLPVEMRVTPSLTCSSGGWRFYVSKISSDNAGYWDNQCGAEFAINSTFSSPSNVEISVTVDSSKAVTISAGDNMMICTNYDSDSSGNQKYPGWLDFDAEII